VRLAIPLQQFVRGFAMGTADIVPGVSGGTVALVAGIYERLIANIHHGATALKHVLRRDVTGVRASLRAVEWVWLLTLLAGVLSAVALLSSALETLLNDHPVRMAGLFAGLVLGAVVVAWRLVRRINAEGLAIMFATGIALFVLLGLRTDTEVADDAVKAVTQSWWVFFLVGAIAICAMILPGISGSFLLVMMGMYTEVLGAVNDRDLPTLAVFALGCVVGLALFSSVLTWLLTHHHDRVVAVMIGLMLGSLRVLWPWPGGTGTTTLAAPRTDIAAPVALAVAGFVVVVGVEFISTRRSAHTAR
jgi:putative membrane protein